jgi:hypothetical protein
MYKYMANTHNLVDFVGMRVRSSTGLEQFLKGRGDIVAFVDFGVDKVTRYYIAPSTAVTWNTIDGYKSGIKDFLNGIASGIEHLEEPKMIEIRLDISSHYDTHAKDRLGHRPSAHAESRNTDIGVLRVSSDAVVFVFKDEESAFSAWSGVILDGGSCLEGLAVAVRRK